MRPSFCTPRREETNASRLMPYGARRLPVGFRNSANPWGSETVLVSTGSVGRQFDPGRSCVAG